MEGRMKYNVSTLREAGLEARWSRTRRGAPILTARDPNGRAPHQRTRWWVVDAHMWERMQSEGVREAFDACTLLGSFFSV